MSIKIEISDPKLIYCAPINEATSKWGVYCIPRLWRAPDGRLVIRFNGEEDSAMVEEAQRAPDLYFVSADDGNTWSQCEGGEELYDPGIIFGTDSPYVHLKDGSCIALKNKENLPPIEGIVPTKEFRVPNGEAIVRCYKYGDIPEQCKALELLKYTVDSPVPKVHNASIGFDEREIQINAFADSGNGKDYVPVPEYIRPFIFKNPFVSAIHELADGTLVGVANGQHPDAGEYCAVQYLLASDDGGITWHYRGTIASDTEAVPYGYGGDGMEATLTIASNGDLLCVMRMDLTIDDWCDKPICDTMLAVSHDNGYTWEKPVPIAESSVTPHIEALSDGIVFVTYGRPGVHFKVSEDNGKTWSESHSIIGKTLSEERAAGRSDVDSKFHDTPSYSNVFVEKLSDDTVLVLYTNLKYDDGDGLNHKAGFVRKITLKKETAQ